MMICPFSPIESYTINSISDIEKKVVNLLLFVIFDILK